MTGDIPGSGSLTIWLAGRFSADEWEWIYQILRWVGRLAFPIFCFLLVEGFLHTHDRKKYALRLGIFAVLSEPCFDLAFSGKLIDMGSQNIFFTLLTGLAVMSVCDGIVRSERWQYSGKMLASAGAFLAGMAVAELLSADYGAIGIFCILILYVPHTDRRRQILAGALSFLWEPPASLAFVPIIWYNGQRGLKLTWFFYAFYPLHLFALYAAAVLL